jgi:hypothetical protein
MEAAPTPSPAQDDTVAEPRPQPCPHCGAGGSHPGLEYCPDTGGRLPAKRHTPTPAIDEEPAQPEPQPAAGDTGAQRAVPRDPHAAYDKAWLLEIRGRDPIGLDDGESVLFGRDPSSPISSWCDENISRRHLEMRVEGDQIYACDLNSMNGTYLNGERLLAGNPTACRDGDTVQLATEDPIHLEIRG